MKRLHRSCAALALFALAAAVALPAHAGLHVYPGNDPKWKGECGSCHLAFPAQLLPADSWRRMLSELTRHFGVDASVVPARTPQGAGSRLEIDPGEEPGKLQRLPYRGGTWRVQ